MKAVKEDIKKRYTLATKAINIETMLVTGCLIILMIVWACFTTDRQLLSIPLLCLIVSVICFVSLLFRFLTEPKIAIQANCDGIYFYYRNNKETFIGFDNIIEVSV